MADNNLPAFGDLLRRARRAAGLTHEELAERAGLSVRGISDLERGVVRAPRRDTLDLLADALDLAPSERRRWEQARRRLATRAVSTASTVFPTEKTNLPIPLTTFIGREREVADVAQLLCRPDIRLVTITGPGGIGKTRLAIEVGRRVLHDYSDGIWFINLAPLSDATLVLSTLAATLNVPLPGNQPVQTALQAALKDQQVLLVVDNVEQVVACAPELAALLAACPSVSILATSRVPLHVHGEHEYALSPLHIPDLSDRGDVSEMVASEAVTLFKQQAEAVRSDFQVTPHNVRVIANICQRLDGLPLAIELAAARIKLLPPHLMLERLDRRLPLLVGGSRDAPARQHTLRDTIQWSYDLLSPDEQTVFRRLSIFRGGWTLDAADAVAGDKHIDVLRTLEGLIDHSLVRVREQPDGTPRYSMLETIREFGLEQLDANGETDAVHTRHAAYFRHYFAPARVEVLGPERSQWTAKSEGELDNVRTALAWAVEHDPVTAIRLNVSFIWYWWSRGHFDEGRRWHERALTNSCSIPSDIRAYALVDISWHATTMGDYAASKAAADEARAIFEELGDERGRYHALFALGRIAMFTNDHHEALRFFDESRRLSRGIDPFHYNSTTANMASTAIRAKENVRAASYLDEGLMNARHEGDVATETLLLALLGELAMKQGDFSRAHDLLTEALSLHREHNLEHRYAMQALELAAWLATCQRFPDRAARLLGAANRVRDTFGVPVPPNTQIEYDQYVPMAKAQTDDVRWERAWSQGRAMTLEEAIDYALSTDMEQRPERVQLSPASMSHREIEVLRLLADGQSNQEIADTLFISPNTVANHVANIMNKLGVESRTAAATWAVKHGIV